MKLKSLSSLLLLLSLNAVAGSEPPLSEEAAEGVQQLAGIKKLETTESLTRYAFREDGNFLISKETFTTNGAAQKFCEQNSGYQLTDVTLPMVLTMSGLPFPDLREQSMISVPALGNPADEVRMQRGGLIFWVKMNYPEGIDFSRATERVKRQIELLKAPDYLWAMTNGDGGSSDGVDSLSRVNAALAALKQPARALSAICVDEALRTHLER